MRASQIFTEKSVNEKLKNSIFTLRLNQTQGIFYLASKLSSEIEKIKSIFESSA
jgi:hypothetical protein